ncbi:hypothetical protein KJ885_03580 [Patescibacteria group bacterium]|nr:hypothetical protein [Patescibacteria group bacterium]
MSRRKRIFLSVILIIAASQIVFWAFFIYLNWGESEKVVVGATFSPYVARDNFELDPKEVLRASLDDLGIKNYRLAANWNVIEQKPGQYYFGDLDWQLSEIAKRNGSVVLAIGRRLPRWPECHDPGWLKGMEEEAVQARVLNLLKIIVNRYKNNDTIIAWQIENEPLLSLFGNCPPPDIDFLKKEVDLVRSLDSRPLVLTASGELSSWTNEAKLADWLGFSLYRTTWSPGAGITSYPLTSIYYKHRARIVKPLVKKIFVSELQAEPWERFPLTQTPLVEQKIMMNKDMIAKEVKFAKKIGVDEVFLWGVEWWYWLKEQGDDAVWNKVKEIVAENMR